MYTIKDIMLNYLIIDYQSMLVVVRNFERLCYLQMGQRRYLVR